MSSTVSGRYMDFMKGAGDSFVASGGAPSITPEDIDVGGFAGPLNGGSRGTPSMTPDLGVVGFGGPIGGATKIISKDDRGVGGFANVGSMLPNPEIEMISALGQIAARGQYGELLNAVKDMPANIASVTDAINNGDMRALGSTVADAVFAAAGAKAKTGMAQGALAAAKNFISPKNVEATAAAQARMPSMAKSFGAAPAANLSAADKAKAALEASKRSAAQPITLGAVASCGGAVAAAATDSVRNKELEAIASDPTIRAEINKAWEESNACSPNELERREQGFYILRDNKTQALSIQKFPDNPGNNHRQTYPGPTPVVEGKTVVAMFHTHPNPEDRSNRLGGFRSSPGFRDWDASDARRLPGVIQSHDGMYYYKVKYLKNVNR